ncbi:hypothetical protein HaLaN_06781, partial [Haematococcus lacustris]
MAAIIRNSHSPALLPFTCSLLACDTASLQGSLHRSLLAAAESDLSSAAQAVAGRRGSLTATATAVPKAVDTTGQTPHFNDCVGEVSHQDWTGSEVGVSSNTGNNGSSPRWTG